MLCVEGVGLDNSFRLIEEHWLLTNVGVEGRELYSLLFCRVVCKLCEWEQGNPIVLCFADEGSQLLLERLVKALSLSVCLWVESR